MGSGITNGSGGAQYSSLSPSLPTTDASGNATLWLLPTNDSPQAVKYDIIATPPSGSIYSPFTLSNISVIGDQTEIVSLQYNHVTPVTTLTLSPAADSNGNYQDPTSITLSAIPASGYTIVNTYYTLDGTSQQTYSSPFTVTGNGSHTITYWSVDNSGVQETHNSKTFTIQTNLPPVVSVLSNAFLNIGDLYSASSSFSDTDSTSWTGTVDYGDGSGVGTLTLNPDKTFSLSHTYTTSGTFTVTVRITDNQGATGISTATVIVNAPPQIAPLLGGSINQGGTYSENGSFIDTDSTSWTATVDYGDGSGLQSLPLSGKTFTLSHTYTTAGTFTETVIVTDNQGAMGAATAAIIVNAPPVVNPISSSSINEGDTYTATGTFTDTDSTSFTATVDYGDGQGVNPIPSSDIDQTNHTFFIHHTYSDEGVSGHYTVSVIVTDNQGASSQPATATVTVNNVPPAVGTITAPSSPTGVNTSVTAQSTFTDPETLDTHTASWNWGDTINGNPDITPGTVTEPNGATPGSVSDSHTYTAAGVYTVTLTVTDDDGVSTTSQPFQYIVIYDPQGGFLTASGKYTSLPGWDLLNPSSTGEVKFGISAQYPTGSTTPTGSTKLMFKVGDLTFSSTSYSWLVVNSGKAYLMGTGTVTGSTDTYALLVTAEDSTQTVRFQLRDNTTQNIVYDTQPGAPEVADPTTSLTSGGIKVH